MYDASLQLLEKFNARAANVDDVRRVLELWNAPPSQWREFYAYIKNDAEKRNNMRTLISYLTNALFDFRVDEMEDISSRALASMNKMYVFLTEGLLANSRLPPLLGIGPALASQVYGDSTIVGNLTKAQMSEFTLPHFTIVDG